MPLPPPPERALSMTGYPMREAASNASSTDSRVSVPGMVLSPASFAICLILDLSLSLSISSAEGPMNAIPFFLQSVAKSAFSERKP